jgi:glutaredoxin-like protein NrdH
MVRTDRNVRLFALSTCGHCRNTRRWLDERGITYECIEVDLKHGEDKRKTLDEMRRFNDRLTFPTMVIDGDHIIIGYHPEDFEEAFGSA